MAARGVEDAGLGLKGCVDAVSALVAVTENNAFNGYADPVVDPEAVSIDPIFDTRLNSLFVEAMGLRGDGKEVVLRPRATNVVVERVILGFGACRRDLE